MRDRIPEAQLAAFLGSTEDGVFLIGHASALVRMNGKLIAFDPVWNHQPYGDEWTFWPAQVNLDTILEKIDLIVISHIHEDHLCDDIIRRAKCNVVIMDGRQQLADRLATSPDRGLSKIAPWTWKPFSDPYQDPVFEMLFVPHPRNTIDSSTFIRNPKTGFTVYVGNDNFLTSLDVVKVHVPHVDIALIPYAFIHWYPYLLDSLSPEQKKKEAERLNGEHMQLAYDFVDNMKPAMVIPTGSSLYYAAPDNQLNSGLTSPYDVCWSGAAAMLAGDWVLANGRSSTPMAEFEFNLGLRQHLRQFKDKVYLEEPYTPTYDDLAKLSSKTGRCPGPERLPEHILSVNDQVFIDLETTTVGRSVGYRPPPYCPSRTRFLFENVVFRKWVTGEITFEQAIGTRRFQCWREPNVYNLKVFEFFNKYL